MKFENRGNWRMLVTYTETARIVNVVEFEFDGTKEEAEQFSQDWKNGKVNIWDLDINSSEVVDILDSWDTEYDYDSLELRRDFNE
jgi:hypothetical protein